MSDIEERLIRLSMDDSDLQRNAKTSLATLKKLDEALTFKEASRSAKNIQTAVNNVDFSILQKKLDDVEQSIKKAFSVKNIIKASGIATVTSAITKDFMGMVGKLNPITGSFNLIKSTLNQIEKGGWTRATNIDQAKFKIEGLGIAFEKVQQQISFGVKNTAYGFDQAARAASQLVASGVKYSESFDLNKAMEDASATDELSRALRGLSGVASMTGGNYDLLADIFVDAAAAGKVTADTFNRLTWQGLNAKQTLKEALNVSSEELDKMARKGQISFQTFADAMDKAYGAQAAKSNETFEGSLANMKAALSRIGAEFATPIRQAGTDLFNTVRIRLGQLEGILSKSSLYKNFTRIIERGVKVINKVINGIPIDFLSNIVDAAGEAMGAIGGLIDKVDDLFVMLGIYDKKAIDNAEDTAEAVEQIVYSEEHILEMANKVIRGDYGNGEERRKTLEAEGEYYELIQNKVNELEGSTFRYAIDESRLAKVTEKKTDAVKKEVEETEALKKARKELSDLREQGLYEDPNHKRTKAEEIAYQKAVEAAEKKVAEEEQKAIKAEQKRSDARERLTYESTNGITKRTKAERIAAGETFKMQRRELTIAEKAKKAQEAVTKTIGKLGTKVAQTGKKITSKSNMEKITIIANNAKSIFYSFLTGAANGVGFVGEKLLDAFTWIYEKLLDIGTFITGIPSALGAWLDKIGAIDKIKGIGKSILTTATSAGSKAVTLIGSLGEKAKTAFGEAKERAKGFWEEFKETEGYARLQDSLDKIKAKFTEIKDWAVSKFNELKDIVSGKIEELIGTSIEFPEFNAENFASAVSEKIIWLLDNLKEVKETVSGFFTDPVGTGKNILADIQDFLSNISFQNAVEWASEQLPKLKDALFGLISLFTGTTVSAAEMDGVTETVGEAAEELNNYEAYIKPIVDKLLLVFDDLKAIAESELPGIWDSIKGFFSALGGAAAAGPALDPSMTGEFDTLYGMSSAAETIDTNLDTGVSISDKIHTIIETIHDAYKAHLKPFIDDLPESWTKVEDFFNTHIKPAIISFGSLRLFLGLSKTFSSIGKITASAAKVTENVSEIVKEAKGIVSEIKEIPKAVAGVITQFKDSIKDITGSVTDFINATRKNFGKVLKAEARLRNAKALFIFAAAILAIVGAMWVIGTQLTPSQTARAVKAVAAIGVVLAILLFAISSFTNNKEVSSNSVDKLADVLKSYKNVVNNFLKGIGKAAIITAIGIAVALIGGVVAKLGRMKFTQGLQGAFFVAIIMGEIIGAMYLLNKLDLGNLRIKSLIMMIVMGLIVRLLSGSVSKLGKMPIDQLAKGVIATGALLYALSEAMKRIGDMQYNVQLRQVLMLVVLAGVIGTVAKSVIKLGKMDIGSLAKGLIAVKIIQTFLNRILFATKNIPKKGGFGTLLGLSLVIMSLVGAVYTLGEMKMSSLAKGMLAMGLLGLVLSGMINSLSKITKKGGFLKSIGIVFIIVALAGSLYALSNVDGNKLRQASTAMTKVMLSVSAMFLSISRISKFGGMNVKQLLATMLPLIGILITIALSLFKLSSLNSYKVLNAAKAISRVMLSLSLVIKSFSKVKFQGVGTGAAIGGTISLFAGIAAIIAELVWVFKSLQGVNSDEMVKQASALALVLAPLGLLISGIGAIASTSMGLTFRGNFMSSLGSGLGAGSAVATIVGVIGLIMYLMGHLPPDTRQKINDFINNGADIIINLGKKIGEFIGAILSEGLFKPLAESFSGFGDKFDTLMDEILKLAQEVSDGDGTNKLDDAIDVLGGIVTAIGELGWDTLVAGIESKLGSIGTGAISTFATNLGELVGTISNLANAFNTNPENGEVDEEYANKLAENLRKIKPVMNALVGIGWSGFVAGLGTGLAEAVNSTDSIKSFVQNLEKIVPEINLMAKAFEEGEMEAINEAGEKIVVHTKDAKALATTIRQVGPVINAIGDIGWEGFVTGLKTELASWTFDSEGVNRFLGNVRNIAEPVRDMVNAFSTIEMKDEQGNTLTVENADIEGMTDKINLIAGVINALGDTAAFASEAGWFADVANSYLGTNDISGETGAIDTFVANMTALAEPTKDLASAFLTSIDTPNSELIDSVEGENSPLLTKLNFINSVLETLRGLGIATQSTGNAVTETIDDVENIKTFCTNVAEVAPSAFQLAEDFSFQTVKTAVGDEIIQSSDGLLYKLQVVNGVLTALDKATFTVANMSWSLSQIVKQDSIASLLSFCANLRLLARPVYRLAWAFDHQLVGDDVTVDSDTMIAQLTAIDNTLYALSQITFKVNGTALPALTAIKGTTALKEFCDSLAQIAPNVYGLAVSLDTIEVSEDEIVESSPEEVKKKLNAINDVINGFKDFTWDVIATDFTAMIGNITGAGNDISIFADSITDVNGSLTKMVQLADNFNNGIGVSSYKEGLELIEGVEADKEVLSDLASEEMDVNDKTFTPLTAAFRAVSDLSNIASSLNYGGMNNMKDATDNLAAIGPNMKIYVDAAKEFDLTDAEVTTINGLINGLLTNFNDIKYDTPSRITAFGEALPTLGTGLGNFTKNLAEGGYDLSSASKLMNDAVSFISAANQLEGITTGVWEEDTPVDRIQGALEQLFGYITNATTGSKETNLTETIAKMLISDSDLKDIEARGKTAGDGFYLNFGKGLNERHKDVITGIKTLFTGGKKSESTGAIIPCIKSLLAPDTFSETIAGIMTSIGQAIRYNGWIVTTRIRSLLDLCTMIINDRSGREFVDSGKHIVEGLAKGIKDNQKIVTDAIKTAAQDTQDAEADEDEINSPSKVYERFGLYRMMGLALGMQEGTPLVLDSVKSAAEATVGAMTTSMSDVSDKTEAAGYNLLSNLVGLYTYINAVVNDALDTQPTITPVMDLSMLNGGLAQMNRSLAFGTYGLGTANAYTRSLFPGTTPYGTAYDPAQVNNLSALEGIRSDIRALGESIQSMQMVMDSGALVGSIGGGMDKELGSIQRLKERWA